MFDPALFLGVPFTRELREEFQRLSSTEQRLLIQEHEGPYLQIFEHDNVEYIGKKLEGVVESASLDILSAHIYSLLRKCAPFGSHSCPPLVLIAYAS